QDLGRVGRRENACRRPVDEGARVDADLLGAVDVKADELEIGAVDHLAQLSKAHRTGGPLDDPDGHNSAGGSSRPPMVPCMTMPLASAKTRRATRNSLPTQPWRMYLPNRIRVPGAPVAAGNILIFSSACLTPTPVSGRALANAIIIRRPTS